VIINIKRVIDKENLRIENQSYCDTQLQNK